MRCDDARDVGNIGVSKKIGKKEYNKPLSRRRLSGMRRRKHSASGRSQSKKEIGALDACRHRDVRGTSQSQREEDAGV